jgi:hypothetical protein
MKYLVLTAAILASYPAAAGEGPRDNTLHPECIPNAALTFRERMQLHFSPQVYYEEQRRKREYCEWLLRRKGSQ